MISIASNACTFRYADTLIRLQHLAHTELRARLSGRIVTSEDRVLQRGVSRLHHSWRKKDSLRAVVVILEVALGLRRP